MHRPVGEARPRPKLGLLRWCRLDLPQSATHKAFRDIGWDPPHVALERVKQLLKENFSGVVATQLSEDSFNLCKNSKRLVKNMRYRTPERCFGILLERDVVGRVHRFTGIAPDEALAKRSVKLSKSVFHAGGQDCSVNSRAIVGTNSRPKWYSSKAEDIGRIFADGQLYLDAKTVGQPSIVETAWLGALCAAGHRLLIRKKAPDAPWFFAMHHFSGSAVAVWPAVVKRFEGYAIEYAEFAPLGEIRLVSVVNLQDYEGSAFVWRSPTWQFVNMPNARGSLPPAVRPVLISKPEALHAVGARHAFWKLEVAWLKKLAEHLGVDLLAGSSLLQILLRLSMSILSCTEEAALVIAAQRISTTHIDNAFASELLEIDEVHDILSKDDVVVFERQQKVAKSKQQERREIEREYLDTAHRVRQAAPKRKKPRSSSSRSVASSRPLRLPPLHELS